MCRCGVTHTVALMQDQKRNVDGNSRLTALLGATVLPAFFAAWLVGKVGGPPLATAHIVIALILAAPLAAKLTTVTYRMVSYYRGVGAYRRRGRPANRLRLLGATLGSSMLVVFASGLVLMFGPASAYVTAKSVHSVAAWLALVAIGLHLAAHGAQTRRLVAAEMRPAAGRPRGFGHRLATVGTTVLCGAILAVALFQQASHVHIPRRGTSRAAVVAAHAGHHHHRA